MTTSDFSLELRPVSLPTKMVNHGNSTTSSTFVSWGGVKESLPENTSGECDELGEVDSVGCLVRGDPEQRLGAEK